MTSVGTVSEKELQVSKSWSSASAPYPRNQCVHKLFRDQVERNPDAIAVQCSNRELSYKQLDELANQLAHSLQRQGVQPNQLVGVYLGRSVDLIVTLLGVLKAGAAYLPLDPVYPKQRIAFILDDADVKILITQNDLLGTLPAFPGNLHCIDRNNAEFQTRQQKAPDHGADPTDLAYVMYTSGSTGKPKGVEVPHRGINRLVLNQNYISFSPLDRVAHLSNIAFDASTFEIWGALLNGSRLVVFPPGKLSLEQIGVEVEQHGVTTMLLTSALFNQMVDSQLEWLAGVKQLLAGGDVLSVNHVRRFIERFPGCRLINAYGPTENTTITCCHRIRVGDLNRNSIPIGRPIANTEVHVLNDDLKPVAIGEPGELYAGGDGLARAYHNRPQLSSERFITIDLFDRENVRLYRTGDVVRWTMDGVIEFVGRTDNQIKVRGYRIETGEIEAALNELEGITQAIVVAHVIENGDKQLIAYMKPDHRSSTSTATIRELLSKQLPHYMVPTYFVWLDEFPLTPHGKVDRRSLPVPDLSKLERETEFVVPKSSMEKSITNIWQDVLGVESIGIIDGFLALGGHSLLATQIVSRIRSLHNVELPLDWMVDSATVAELAVLVESKRCVDLKDATDIPRFERVSRDGEIPLTYAQERVWFLHKLHPDIMAYNFEAGFWMDGNLDVTALERALNEVVRRHEVFRTAFIEKDGKPTQEIHPFEPFSLQLIDFSHLSLESAKSVVQKITREEYLTAFLLEKPGLIRWKLLRLTPTQHVLIQVEHHLVHDGWSFTVFLRELQVLYDAFHKGKPAELPEPKYQLADYAVWQRRYCEGPIPNHQLPFWKNKLHDCPAFLELPFDHPRPSVQSFKGETLRSSLPVSLRDLLTDVARSENTSLYMLMLSVFYVLLHRYTNQTDLCVGTSIANRRWDETESVIGMTLNNLVLRASMDGNPTFREVIALVTRISLEAYAHQDVPFEKVVEAVDPVRSLSYSPLFQVMFSFHDSQMESFRLADLKTKVEIGLFYESSKFDMTITLVPHCEKLGGEGMELLWEYNSDLMEGSTAVRMRDHYIRLIEQISKHLDKPISEVCLLSTQEVQELVFDWNQTDHAYPSDRWVHEWFEYQAQATPHAMAVVSRNQNLSFFDLNARSNQLARYLKETGLEQGDIVGIYMGRSPLMIVAMMGVLKAGLTILPLDPSYPAERIRFMVSDSRMRVRLSEEVLSHRLGLESVLSINVDVSWASILKQSVENIGTALHANSPAYIIYTSGSTGNPKGMIIPHSAILNHMLWMLRKFPLSNRDAVLQKTPISFDASVWEWLAPLMSGACLILANTDGHKDPAYLAELIEKENVTVLQVVPTLLGALLGSDSFRHCESLKRVFSGGEVLSRELAARFADSLPYAELVNLYGPAEATIDSTYWIYRSPGDSPSVPIGRPIDNVKAYILDDHLRPVPLGVTGELFIGGAGVGLGYLNQPNLSKEKFIANPFTDDKNSKLYRTGDLARYRSDGAIEFVGRRDGQVKLRGYRIELGEIEAVLNQFNGVKETVVAVLNATSGDERIVAYVVSRNPHPSSQELMEYLKTRLPDYMIPATFLFLDSLPLTPSGKLDRRSLPVPDWTERHESEQFVSPRTDTELRLAHIWSEVLGLHQVGINDNFFALGGHSLSLTQIVSRIRSEFGMEIPLRQVFSALTISRLAEIVDSRAADPDDCNTIL